MTEQKVSQMVRVTDRAVVCERAYIARSWLARLRGLLGTSELPADEGLWLSPCNSVHSLGMRYAIDVIFLNRELQVTKVVECLEPRRARFGPRGTHSALELPAGTATKLKIAVGDRLRFSTHPHESDTTETSHVH